MQTQKEEQQPATVRNYYQEKREQILAVAKQDRLTRREKDLKEVKLPKFLAPYIKLNKKTISLVVSNVDEFLVVWGILAQNYNTYVTNGKLSSLLVDCDGI